MRLSEWCLCSCQMVIYNSPRSIARHKRICEREDNEAQYSCSHCRAGAHLLCDGGSCRCTCTLDLDVRRRAA